ncbi:hypothetical protein HTZ77_11615 [Nonomuraea sp. SMC257]|uniref:Uncharacterized protein n=1 Tax=Nonomuraea montanisoli TaxID=2741721 RepID=A0A7Y6M3B8_9ACTN|nr:hypothetical protein [Nonomuraea montanisoli]NUW32074.1 hypothetical protein [Nonomuraea montanisoli]
MTHEEKRAWIRLVVSVVAYAAYAVIIAGRAGGRPLAEVPYEAALLWSVGGAVAASILAEIVMAMVNPRASRVRDVRDREIARFGDHVGQAFVAIGAIAAMLMAMAGWERFWIANAVYLCFVVSAVLGGFAKVAAYRRSMPEW